MPLFQRLSVIAALMAGIPLSATAAPAVNQVPVRVERPAELVLVARNKRPRSEGVTAVIYPGGQFRKVGPNKWIERSDNGGFKFREVGNDGRTITLWDRSRNVYIYLNLRRERVFYAPDGEEPRDLYPIISVIKDAPNDDMEETDSEPAKPQRARFTCEEGVPMDVRFEDRGERSLAWVSIDGSPEMRLKQIPAASGAKYSNGEYTVWTKGRNATLEINGDTDICVGG